MGNSGSVHISFEYNPQPIDTRKFPDAREDLLIRFQDYYKTQTLNIIFKISKKKSNSRHIIQKFKDQLPNLESGEILVLELEGDSTFLPDFPLSFSKTKTGYFVTHKTNGIPIFEFETDASLVQQLETLSLELLNKL